MVLGQKLVGLNCLLTHWVLPDHLEIVVGDLRVAGGTALPDLGDDFGLFGVGDREYALVAAGGFLFRCGGHTACLLSLVQQREYRDIESLIKSKSSQNTSVRRPRCCRLVQNVRLSIHGQRRKMPTVRLWSLVSRSASDRDMIGSCVRGS